MTGWQEFADGVLVRRYAELDLSVGLVLGDERALVVDSRGDDEQGREWCAAVREVTTKPCEVVLTHAHFDHCFGTRAFLPARVWAHRRCRTVLARSAVRQRQCWVRHYLAEGDRATAEALATTAPVLPDHLVDDEHVLDLGGRSVRLRHPGRGHTDHDLIVEIADAAVVFAGDLVEQGAPPDFEDAHPETWPSTLDSVLISLPRLVIPGHGAPVSPDFVRAQAANIASTAALARRVRCGELDLDTARAHCPYPTDTFDAALARVAE